MEIFDIFRILWGAFVGVCVLWGGIRYLTKKIRERATRESSESAGVSLSRLLGRFGSLMHWQKEEAFSFGRVYREKISEVRSEDERGQLERLFETEVARLKNANRRLNRAVVFALAVTLIALTHYGFQGGGVCAMILFVTPFLLVEMHMHEYKDVYTWVPLPSIERSATKRDLFANAVWAISLAAFFAMMHWKAWEGY